MEKPLLVASDVDGTLLDPREQPSARTAGVVSRVLADDTPFVFVTGRPPRWMPPVFDRLGAVSVAVCANGAVHYDGRSDRVTGAVTIPPERLAGAVSRIDEVLPGCAYGVERVRIGAGAGHPDQAFLGEPEFRRVWPNPDCRVVSRGEVLGGDAVKLMVLHEEMSSAYMAARVETALDDRLHMTFSSEGGLLELSAAGVDKASGLAGVAERIGVPAGDVIAFGDMPNDLAMLQWAGHGVAMRNAHEALPHVANEVTASNREDGVAQVLERWF